MNGNRCSAGGRLNSVHRYSAGNAMVEFLVVAAVLVPVFLWIPKLGKLGEVNQVGVQATRYALWERTISDESLKPDDVLLAEVQARVMQTSDSRIITDPNAGGEVENASISYSITGEPPLISTAPNAMLLNTTNSELTGAEGTTMFTDAINTVGGALDGVISGADWSVEQKGLVTVDFSMAIAHGDAAPNDCVQATAENPCWSRGYTMFMDGWNAADPDQAVERIKAFVPAGALAPVADALSLLGAVPLFEELEKLDGSFGAVNPDVVPLDRFGDE